MHNVITHTQKKKTRGSDSGEGGGGEREKAREIQNITQYDTHYMME
jgi:hypothetical protein